MSQIDSGGFGGCSVEYPNSRKTFWANTRHWVFYCDGINIVYSTSLDAINWTAIQNIQPCSLGSQFSIWFDGTYFHYARYNNYTLYYRRGTPNADGSITWSAAEQTVHSGTSTNYYQFPVVIADSIRYPWIGTQHVSASGTFPAIWKSMTLGGIWTTDIGFPYEPPGLSSSTSWNTLLVPLTSARIYFMYAYVNSRIRGRLWVGVWAGEEWVTTSNTHQMWTASAVNQGDNIHLVFKTASPYSIRYVLYTFGVGWAAEVLVQNNVAYGTYVTLGRHQSTNDLYAWWQHSPTTDHIYYKRYHAGAWDAAPTDWYTQTNLYVGQINAHYMDYHTDYICVAWGWYDAGFLDHVSYLCLSLVVAPPPKAGLHPSKVVPLIIDE